MKPKPKAYTKFTEALKATNTLAIQAPLPFPFDKLPKLLTTTGQGTASGRAAPLAPPKETDHA